MAGLLDRLAPTAAEYRHDDMTIRRVNLTPGEPANGYSHCRALLLGASETLNVVDGQLDLGRWQRVFLVELDRDKGREGQRDGHGIWWIEHRYQVTSVRNTVRQPPATYR